MDTSALVAALVDDHEHHALARPRLTGATRLPAIVLAEAYAQLRRTFRQPSVIAAQVLEPWATNQRLVLGTAPRTLVKVLRRAVELDLGGNVHDALVAQVCVDHGVGLVTLDRRQHAVALAFGAKSTFLLA